MIFTEDDKAHLKHFVPYIRNDYGLRRVMKEFPGKRRNTFGLDNLSRSCIKNGMSKRTHGVEYRLCVGLTSDAIGYSD